MEGTSETQAELELRLRGRARAELGLLREEPGLEARGGNGGGLKIGGGCGRVEPRLEPGAPALHLVSCSPGQQLEGRDREGM